MADRVEQEVKRESVGIGVVTLLLTGTLLGLAYNAIGHASRPSWGLPWIAVDRAAQLAEMPQVMPVDPSDDGGYLTDVNDPLAVGAPSTVPQIPDVGRPVQIQIEALKQFFDADAALIVDAREPDEYAESHIPGALNVPYDTAVTDPALLESIDSGGRPIITYCGGGSCELSLNLAEELFFAGHDRVAVYMGGFPEWVELGYPVSTGEAH